MSFSVYNDVLSVNDFNTNSQNVSIGRNSGLNQGLESVAIGVNCGSEGANSVSIGTFAGQFLQHADGVSIGDLAGRYNQGENGIAIGYEAGSTNQGYSSIGIGIDAGAFSQGDNAVSIGNSAGYTAQGAFCVAIGISCATNNQGQNSVAIGNTAAYDNQGHNCIALGAYAGQNSQHANSIVLNATGTTLNSTNTNSFYVKPLQGASGATNRILFYNNSTGEFTYSSSNTSANNKSFIIDHPLNDDKYLVHVCLEGPEAGVYYRGKSEIINDESVEILLPEYTKAFSEFTVQITPVCNSSNNIQTYGSSEVENGRFTVYGKNGKFFWMVNGMRNQIEVEPLKSESEVRGDGPYKYFL